MTAGRAAVAGLLSLAYLALTGAPRPRRDQWLTLGSAPPARWSASRCCCPRAARSRLDARRRRDRCPAAGNRHRRGGAPAPAAVAGLLAVRRCRLARWSSALPCTAAAPRSSRRRAAAGGGRERRDQLRGRRAAVGAVARRTGDLLGARREPAADLAGDARRLAGAGRACRGLGRLYLRHAVLDVARLLRLVPGLALGGTVRVSQVQLVQPFLALSPRCRSSASSSTPRPSRSRSP